MLICSVMGLNHLFYAKAAAYLFLTSGDRDSTRYCHNSFKIAFGNVLTSIYGG